jgi:PAS domain S-box-containing protein
VFPYVRRSYDRLKLKPILEHFSLDGPYGQFNLQRIAERFNLQLIDRGINLQRWGKRLRMQRIYRRFSIVIGFLILLVLLISNTVITRHLLDVQANDEEWVSHTEQILTQVAQIQSLLANAEAGERGYIYTRDPNYLASYGLAIAQLDANLQRLQQATADNPREQPRIVKLRSLVQIKMEMLSMTILLLQSGYSNYANESVVSERGRLLTVEIDTLMDKIAREEGSLSGSRSATFQLSRDRTIASIYAASGGVALGLILLAYHILREARLRDRHAQERLASEKWFRSVLTSLGHAVIATDKKGVVTFLNPKAERLMGIRLRHAKGQPVEKVFPVFDETTLLPIKNSVTKVIEYGQPTDIEHQAFLRGSDGKLIPIKNNATLIRDRRDKLLGAVLVFRDLSHEHQTKDLHDTDRFAVSPTLLATASHHIDAPLVAACNLIYVAKLNDGVSSDASNLLTLAEGHLGRASHISREILGFYRQSEAFEQIDLSVLLNSVLKSFSTRFGLKAITLVRDFHLCPSVSGIARELTQALSNLISNAVDAVPFGGTIHIRLSYAAEGDARAVTLSIQDDGPGIQETDRGHLFEPFFTTKVGTGYGLGLWSTKGIVERHGGIVQVKHEDAAGVRGTVFDILLPVEI